MTMATMPVQKSAATTHRSVHFRTNVSEEAVVMFYIRTAFFKLTPFFVARLRGRAATRWVVPPSCARVVSKKLALLIKKGSFLCVTMLPGKLRANTNTLQV